MSTIERAMGLLRGEPEVREATQTAPAPSTVAEARPAPADLPPAAPASEIPRIAGPAGRTAAEADDPRAPPAAFVDYQRLAQRGFLVPGEEANLKSEEYQHIKRRLLGNMVSGIMQSHAPTNLIMITSSVPGEGKTFSSMNLAVSIAMEIDRTVLLVDTDVIKRDLTRLFGAEGRPGLFDLLSDQSLAVPDVLLRTNIPKLVLMPCGTIKAVATERLASEGMRRLAEELARRYPDRIILFDCPPVLATTGAAALAQHVGQVVMVVEAGKMSQETLKRALDLLDSVTIAGFILNKSKQPPASSKYYGYGYYQQAQKS